MNLDRMKFAWARGARVERRYSFHPGGNTVPCTGWEPVAHAPTYEDGCEYRIFPGHTHLQYGPLSSVLREYIEAGCQEPRTYMLQAAIDMARALGVEGLGYYIGAYPVSHWQVLYGFAAELLADQGL